jgi:hypothetical protein
VTCERCWARGCFQRGGDGDGGCGDCKSIKETCL